MGHAPTANWCCFIFPVSARDLGRLCWGVLPTVVGHIMCTLCVCLRASDTKMTDRGMRAVADMVAAHPSLEVMDVTCESCCPWMMCNEFEDVCTSVVTVA